MKILVPAYNLFEDAELIVPLTLFKRCGIHYDVVSLEGHTELQGDKVASVKVDVNTFNESDYNAIFLHGGTAVEKSMRGSDELVKLVKKFKNTGKPIFAICDAPNFLYEKQIIINEPYTSYPIKGLKSGPNRQENNKVVASPTLITGKGPGAAFEFAFAIIELAGGKELSLAIKESTMFAI